jgi:hypothetical protein
MEQSPFSRITWEPRLAVPAELGIVGDTKISGRRRIVEQWVLLALLTVGIALSAAGVLVARWVSSGEAEAPIRRDIAGR